MWMRKLVIQKILQEAPRIFNAGYKAWRAFNKFEGKFYTNLYRDRTASRIVRGSLAAGSAAQYLYQGGGNGIGNETSDVNGPKARPSDKARGGQFRNSNKSYRSNRSNNKFKRCSCPGKHYRGRNRF